MAQAPNPRIAALMQRVNEWNRTHPPKQQIDPKAELAVASREGLSGGIGDGGHAFGPNQENDAGGVLTGRFPGLSVQQKQAWAWSPQGIDDALARVASVAGGMRGGAAVRNIVTRFERPADPRGEIAGALAAYGGQTGGAGAATPSVPAPAAAGTPPTPGQPRQPANPTAALLTALSGSGGNLTGFYRQLGSALAARRQAAEPVTPGTTPAGTLPQPVRGRDLSPQIPDGPVVGGQGEDPRFLAALADLAGARHAPVNINSGLRSLADQQRLWNNRANNPNPVARPGTSLHERGLAADGTIGGVPLGTLPAALLAKYGLATVPGDRVHVQWTGR